MSEKVALLGGQPKRLDNAQRSSFKTHFLLSILRLGIFLSVLWICMPILLPARPGHYHEKNRKDMKTLDKPWSWEDLQPGTELKWEPCYNETYQCSRLEVPMDWQDPGKEKVILAVMKLPAKNETGTVFSLFTNPGGPGGSGIDFLKRKSAQIQKIIGEDYEIISWDPRGVGLSTPRIECFGSPQKTEIWKFQTGNEAFSDQPGSVYKNFASLSALSNACESYLNDTGIMRHMSTAYTARDMIEIVDKVGHHKFKYWGFSYGTLLGGALAGMFPDRVERLVSDGNAAYDDWYSGEMMHFFDDQDLIWDAFDSGCHELGKDGCALWAESASAIKKRRLAILESARKNPVLIPAGATEKGPELPLIVTYSLLKMSSVQAMYTPFGKVRKIAEAYKGLEFGDGIPFFELIGSPGYDELCFLSDTPASLPIETGVEETQTGVVVNADNGNSIESAEELVEYIERASKVSEFIGSDAAFLRSLTAGRKVQPKWRFSHKDIKKDTAFPILYVGNIADNVTPLRNAFQNSKFFPSSRVLTQKSYGHCSLSTPSVCTAKHIRAYFRDGVLPARGTECDADYGLWEEVDEESVNALGADASEDDKLRAVLLEASKDLNIKFNM